MNSRTRDPTVCQNIGVALFTQEHYAAAKAEYEKGLAIIEADPLSASVDNVALLCGNYACRLGKPGDLPEAKKYLSLAASMGYGEDSIRRICEDLHLKQKDL